MSAAIVPILPSDRIGPLVLTFLPRVSSMFGNKQELPQLRTTEASRFGNIQLLGQGRPVEVDTVPQVLRLHAPAFSLKCVGVNGRQ